VTPVRQPCGSAVGVVLFRPPETVLEALTLVLERLVVGQPSGKIETWRNGIRSRVRTHSFAELLSRIGDWPYNETLVHLSECDIALVTPPGASKEIAIRFRPSPSSVLWERIEPLTDWVGRDRSVVSAHAEEQTALAFCPHLELPHYLELQMGRASVDRSELSSLARQVLHCIAPFMEPGTLAFADDLSGWHTPRSSTWWRSTTTERRALGFPRVSEAWFCDRDTVRSIRRRLADQDIDHETHEDDAAGCLVLGGGASRDRLLEQLLADWIVQSDWRTEAEFSFEAGDYILADGTSVQSVARERELRNRGLVNVTESEEELMPLMRPQDARGLGIDPDRLPSLWLDAWSAAEYERLVSRHLQGGRAVVDDLLTAYESALGEFSGAEAWSKEVGGILRRLATANWAP